MHNTDALNAFHETQAVLRGRREDLGLTQAQVSARMARGVRYVAHLERFDQRVPAFTTIVEWAAAVGLELVWREIDASQE